MRNLTMLLTGLCLALTACASAARVIYPLNTEAGRVKEGRYTVEPDHVSLLFAVDHLGFSTLYGRFNTVRGTLNLDRAHPELSDVAIEVEMASVDTRVPSLDEKLKAGSMFNVKAYPVAKFTSSDIVPTGEKTATIRGTLALAGVARPLELKARFVGSGTNPLGGKATVGFEAEALIKRSNFGLDNWLPIVGDDVKLIVSVEFARD